MVFLRAGDDATLESVPDVMPDGRIAPRLKVTAEGDCVYLGEGGCTIYERRPWLCRIFDCREHHGLPRAERRRIEKQLGEHDLRIIARGRELKEIT